MALKIIAWVLASVIGAILYRMGGADKPYNTKCRDFGCPTVAVILMTILIGWHWVYIACFGLFFAALTTYWKKKGTNGTIWTWSLTGFAYAVSWLPYTILSGHWLGFSIRVVIVTGMVLFDMYQVKNAVWSECARGAICIATLPLLLI